MRSICDMSGACSMTYTFILFILPEGCGTLSIVIVPIHKWYLQHVKDKPRTLPSGQYGLSFGYFFSGPLPLRSHFNSPPFGVCFRESLVWIDYTQKLTRSILALKLSVALPIYLWVTATQPLPVKLSAWYDRVNMENFLNYLQTQYILALKRPIIL